MNSSTRETNRLQWLEPVPGALQSAPGWPETDMEYVSGISTSKSLTTSMNRNAT